MFFNRSPKLSRSQLFPVLTGLPRPHSPLFPFTNTPTDKSVAHKKSAWGYPRRFFHTKLLTAA